MKKKRIAFLTIRSIFSISSLPKYETIFGDNSYDIIFWERYSTDDKSKAKNEYSFVYNLNNKATKLQTLKGYIKFYKFAKKILKNNEYDIIIVLPTQTALLFFFVLVSKYKNKYIYDIRDYTKESNKIFYLLQKILIDKSMKTVITSPAYKKFLPKSEYIISHNKVNIPGNTIKKFRNKITKEDPIVISCIGGIRFIDQFKKVIKIFKNDSRFELRFIGRGSEKLEKYIEENDISNVKLTGLFSSKDTLSFYEGTDVIMNLYGNGNSSLDYALSNKLYYAAYLGLPILVSPNTYMEVISEKYQFGFSFDLENKDAIDDFYRYYKNLDWKEFYSNCDKFIENIQDDEEKFFSEIERSIYY